MPITAISLASRAVVSKDEGERGVRSMRAVVLAVCALSALLADSERTAA